MSHTPSPITQYIVHPYSIPHHTLLNVKPKEAMAGLGFTEDNCAYPQATPIQLANETTTHALHVNGLTPHTP